MFDVKSVTLKLCPCCNAPAKLRTTSPDYFSAGDHTKVYGVIRCTRCPLKTGRYQDIAKLVLAWNTRGAAQDAAGLADMEAGKLFRNVMDGLRLLHGQEGVAQSDASSAKYAIKWLDGIVEYGVGKDYNGQPDPCHLAYALIEILDLAQKHKISLAALADYMLGTINMYYQSHNLATPEDWPAAYANQVSSEEEIRKFQEDGIAHLNAVAEARDAGDSEEVNRLINAKWGHLIGE